MKTSVGVILMLLFSLTVGKNKKESIVELMNINYSIDTVIVKNGKDFYKLQSDFLVSTTSNDKKYLFNWNQEEAELFKVNLDQFFIEEKIKFKIEGDDGVGTFIEWISYLEGDQVLFCNFEGFKIFSLNGEKMKTFSFEEGKFKGDLLIGDENFTSQPIFSKHVNLVYGIFGEGIGNNFYLSRIDLENKILKKHKLTSFEKLADFSVKLDLDSILLFSTPEQNITEFENKLIISNSAFNTLVIYDIAFDSLHQVEYKNKLTKNEKTGDYLNEVETEKDFRIALNEIDQEINFGNLIWDSKMTCFYRFSFENIAKENNLGKNEKIRSKVFLTILDKDFQVLGETLIKELQNRPNFHFVKDGKIWIFENIDDEMAFIRLSIDSQE